MDSLEDKNSFADIKISYLYKQGANKGGAAIQKGFSVSSSIFTIDLERRDRGEGVETVLTIRNSQGLSQAKLVLDRGGSSNRRGPRLKRVKGLPSHPYLRQSAEQEKRGRADFLFAQTGPRNFERRLSLRPEELVFATLVSLSCP